LAQAPIASKDRVRFMVSSQKWQQIRIRVPLRMLPGRASPVNAPARFRLRFRSGIAALSRALDHRRPPGDLFGERSPHPIGAGVDRQLETGRDQLVLQFRGGHGDAGRTIDPIDDLLRGPGRSEQPDQIE